MTRPELPSNPHQDGDEPLEGNIVSPMQGPEPDWSSLLITPPSEGVRNRLKHLGQYLIPIQGEVVDSEIVDGDTDTEGLLPGMDPEPSRMSGPHTARRIVADNPYAWQWDPLGAEELMEGLIRRASEGVDTAPDTPDDASEKPRPSLYFDDIKIKPDGPLNLDFLDHMAERYTVPRDTLYHTQYTWDHTGLGELVSEGLRRYLDRDAQCIDGRISDTDLVSPDESIVRGSSAEYYQPDPEAYPTGFRWSPTLIDGDETAPEQPVEQDAEQ